MKNQAEISVASIFDEIMPLSRRSLASRPNILYENPNANTESGAAERGENSNANVEKIQKQTQNGAADRGENPNANPESGAAERGPPVQPAKTKKHKPVCICKSSCPLLMAFKTQQHCLGAIDLRGKTVKVHKVHALGVTFYGGGVLTRKNREVMLQKEPGQHKYVGNRRDFDVTLQFLQNAWTLHVQTMYGGGVFKAKGDQVSLTPAPNTTQHTLAHSHIHTLTHYQQQKYYYKPEAFQWENFELQRGQDIHFKIRVLFQIVSPTATQVHKSRFGIFAKDMHMEQINNIKRHYALGQLLSHSLARSLIFATQSRTATHINTGDAYDTLCQKNGIAKLDSCTLKKLILKCQPPLTCINVKNWDTTNKGKLEGTITSIKMEQMCVEPARSTVVRLLSYIHGPDTVFTFLKGKYNTQGFRWNYDKNVAEEFSTKDALTNRGDFDVDDPLTPFSP